MNKFIREQLRRFGYYLIDKNPHDHAFRDLSGEQKKTIQTVKPFTMTSPERILAAVNAASYVCLNKLPGDIVECGVWRGGSMMAIALTLLAHGDRSRSLYLYDTFEGMSAPTTKDARMDGTPAEQLLANETKAEGRGMWCYASMEDVRKNILSTGYPADKIFLIKGKVEDSIPQTLPSSISLLRLDTDWYESTKHELVHLYPKLCPKGALIIDDYGHWQGAKKAVDEYFNEIDECVYLHRIDYTGRMLIKSAA